MGTRYNTKKTPFYFESAGYHVKIAETAREIEQALCLRYAIFKLEMGLAIKANEATRQDEDPFDFFCDHLIVKGPGKNNAVVGTCRLQKREVAEKNIGLYLEEEFDISGIMDHFEGFAEVGRKCIHPAYRNGLVMRLIWGGISLYLAHHKLDRILACCSIFSNDINKINRYYTFLRKFYSPVYGTIAHPREDNRIRNLNMGENYSCKNAKNIIGSLPPVIRACLLMNGKLCGEPAFDPNFNSTDFLFLVENSGIWERVFNRYSKLSLK